MGALAVAHNVRGDGQQAVDRMLDRVPHRGAGCATRTVGDTTVGVRFDAVAPRASIAGNADWVVALAGTLDNLQDLAAQLPAGPGPDDVSPASLVLAAWSAWGTSTLARLRGQYAIVVSDGRTVTCARDHFGFRPLFVHHGPRGLFAASEVKQVVAGAQLAWDPDIDHLERVLYGGIKTSTAIRGVERVPRGSFLVAEPQHAPRAIRYWDPAPLVESLDIDIEEARRELVRLLRQATTRVLRGQDAVLLSGGLDSPSIAAFAASSSAPVRALSGVYPKYPEVDELPWIELVTTHLGMPLSTWEPTAGALDDLDLWLRRLDGPVDTLSIPECADAYRQARDLGVRTVLTGELAENVLDGRAYLLDHLLAHGRWAAVGRELRERRRNGHAWRGIVRTTMRGFAPAAALNARHRRHPRRLRTLPAWIDPAVIREQEARRRVSSARRRWISLQTASFSGSAIGYEADEICGAHFGVEIRRPFADVDLWEFALALPAEVKSPPDLRSKALLREAMRPYLPAEIIDRRDKTFFDTYQLAKADYQALSSALSHPRAQLRGIDYGLLAQRLSTQDLGVIELHWARDLARVQAFLDRC